jgi:hypothetical protein
MNDSTNPLRDTAFMTAFLDLIIPPSADGAMPGAGTLELGDSLADQVERDPISGPLVGAGLEAVYIAALARNPGGLPSLDSVVRLQLVEQAIVDHPHLIPALVRHLYPAYYQHPVVLQALGEPARPPFPLGFDIEPTDEHLLAVLKSRASTPG